MRPTDGRIVDQLPLAQSYDAGGGVGGTRAIPAEEIPPAEKVTELAATAARLFDDRTAGLIYLPAFGGLRISECLALRRDDCFQQGPDGSWRIEIREPVHKSRRKTLPPKWRKRRWAFA
ncbi:hypothetical protein, partial [Nitriliruptor alkaliphilus]|uniref:hypothetical protein n=1 Tax=Nitriliruptor alkaliphilus TaxID=427918 RepID=UPI000695A8E3